MVGGWSLGVVLGLFPPPTLPDLPQRGMRSVVAADAEAKANKRAEAEAEAGPGPGAEKPQGSPSGSGSGTGSPSKTTETTNTTAPRQPAPVPAAQPHGPPKPPPGKAVPVRPRSVQTSEAATTDDAGALPLATQADYAAWEADDQRAAAPLPRTDDPGPGSSRPPGDRPTTPTTSSGSLGSDVVVRQAQAEPDPTPRFRRPGDPPTRSATFVLGYRSFALADALGRRQSWHLGSLEVTPLRRYFRLNLLTEIGVEGGEAARAGDRADFMLMQKLGLGVQYPHWVTPFIEGQGGIGMTRVELFERNDLALTWSAGIDAGAQWAVTRWMFLHAAIGWVHPVIAMPAGTVHFDRVAFKVGVGF